MPFDQARNKAAWDTWTGRILTKKGYKIVEEFDFLPVGATGNFTYVKCTFKK